MALKNLTFMEG